ncbi:autotransporter outer membrane beta-barrel domain-containing protein [Xanthobacter agilis]|uniref:Autotransporter domain-containing protein n=1 Tax=Xanthobacter agilis TaxID=47492 RepID=A0ABU0LBM3_XANAG|nr:autotransporter outer membrane beta-barrel domain-containing protein [Xanthobacter agilis]MDQ0504524.1 hypothetical protein [Xanthobacter agilis]
MSFSAVPSGTYYFTYSGIVAYSQGGKGGNGGDTGSTSYSGGGGGKGGDGGDVLLQNALPIATTGSSAYGIWLQSIGGQGGDGGDEDSSLSSGDGGEAGAGGTGGNVQLLNYASVSSATATAVFVQSIGGVGGDGGSASGWFGGVSGGGGYGGDSSGVSVSTLGPNSTAHTATITTWAAGSHGIFAQSVGGGGGDAGVAAGLVALGGSGGPAGNAGQVLVINYDDITVTGASSAAIVAQSVGGAGGAGGMAFSGAPGLAVAIGGSGGGGGTSGQVLVVNEGNICTGTCNGIVASSTTAGGSYGILAQSLGGGGGNGGFGLSGSASAVAGASVALGGSGGGGGSAEAVVVDNVGSISTAEINSAGILAQSIGGGGGNAGGAVAFSMTVAGAATSISHGGSGGSGGSGGAVATNCDTYTGHTSANNACASLTFADPTIGGPFPSSTIATLGSSSPGILAQSIGGGGGNGGYAVSLSASAFGEFSVSLGGSDGGSGGTGGSAGSIYAATNGVQILTYGDDSAGIMGQSIGGGGGAAGAAITGSLSSGGTVALALGGSGGTGGNGGSVVADNPGGVITTYGERSHGLVAQSVGGGGGAGGEAIAVTAGGEDYSVGLAIGGSGGSGGTGGTVLVYNEDSSVNSAYGSANITTYGYGASALIAQSIGGGGGVGGVSVDADVSLTSGAAVSIGGTGGSGGAAGTVNVYNYGQLAAYGGGAPVVLAQSIGGGGGAGGFAIAGNISDSNGASLAIGGGGGAGSLGNEVGVLSYGNIISEAGTAGNAPGVVVQALGGSGGNGGFAVSGSMASGSLSLALGGSGGTGGTSGVAYAYTYGSVTTSGALSAGVIDQSIGGAGGNGGLAVAGGLSGGTAASISIGGGGGAGGISYGVGVIAASISTAGSQSPGVLAQSIGGAGGNGGWDVAAQVGDDAAVTLSVGGTGGAGGKVAGTTTVTVTGAVTTDGLLSPGVVAQSIGGNGGNGGFSAGATLAMQSAASFAIGAGGGTGGASDDVTVTLSGVITTAQDQSIGVLAQSIGGSGGSGGYALAGAYGVGNGGEMSIGDASAFGGTGGSGQNAGDVSVSTNSNIYTQGLLSAGIVAQSIGGAGGNGGESRAESLSSVGVEGTSYTPSASGYSMSLTLGGDGASGGNAGDVTVTVAPDYNGNGYIQTGTALTSDTTTLTSFAPGILAQSIGGSGGNGGSADSMSTANEVSLSLAIGGTGGAGGDGGAVLVSFTVGRLSGGIVTYGDQSPAIIAQSVGGGGGNGGASEAYSQYKKYSSNYTAEIAIGGDGTGGGNGGTVEVDQANPIVTYGDYSAGIIAQSIGGGGGNGGASTTDANSLLTSAAAQVIIAAAGSAGSEAVEDTDYAYWIASSYFGATPTQSTSKSKNVTAASLSVGGAAGAGGDGNAVTVSAMSIQTSGTLSPAVFAQSVGGGGGNGGNGVANSAGKTYGASLTIGGSGGDGGNGGTVYVQSGSNIQTLGTQSAGIIAQSVGGGGGNGGSAVSSVKGGNSNSTSSRQRGVAAMAIGGTGGSGGVGGAVTVVSGAEGLGSYINTLGASAPGIFAQSVGGGGGNGGSTSVSTITQVKVTLSTTEAKAYTALGLNFAGQLEGAGSSSGVAFDNKQGKGSQTYIDSTGDAVGLSIGGSGGGAGYGGAVSITNYAVIVTGTPLTSDTEAAVEDPDNSPAIVAQSVGGGGGNGGSSRYHSSANEFSTSMSLGGDGGSAAPGGTVSVDTQGTLVTLGNNSAAILAQSVGGGGGNGGNAASSLGGVTTASLALGLGGSGTGGGDGGTVTVNVTAGVDAFGVTPGIWTSGAQSYGIVAQSVGGGGGSAGSFVTSTANTYQYVTGTGGETYSATTGSSVITDAGIGVAIAQGSSGNGGSGGLVTVTSATPITTLGAQAVGIVAQSLGGGGGISGSGTTNTANATYLLSFTLGTSSATDSTGNAVTVTQSGAISTSGALAHGILAQSVGGGGGLVGDVSSTTATSGDASMEMTLGASGGSGLNAGIVSATASANVITTGAGAAGILAQSVGGGGGVAGAAFSSGSNGDAATTLALGASGGDGDGGNVSANMLESVSTAGANAAALVAQSVGGGGGIASVATTTSAALGTVTATLTLGASGSASGNGGGVFANFSDSPDGGPSLVTTGVNAYALVAQSIGGGGGIADVSNDGATGAGSVTTTFALGGGVGAGGNVSVMTDDAVVATSGAGAIGLLVQSVGGGGGTAGSSAAMASEANGSGSAAYQSTLLLGGSSGGAGGAVSLENWVTTSTTGDFAPAVLVQSIAGGGGVASGIAAVTGSLASRNVTLSLGGTDGLSADAGQVSVDTYRSVATTGEESHGIVAQSVAGGGGFAGVLLIGDGTTSVNTQHTTVLGASGGTSGDGGAVTLNVSTNVSTSGGLAIGIVAQSIGGGGGMAGLPTADQASLSFAGSVTLGGSAGGNGASVSVSAIGGWTISTTGNAAYGIVAQSIGGGGGIATMKADSLILGGSSGGNGGTVSVTTSSQIITTGSSSIGIVAQSIGGGGGLGRSNSTVSFAGTSGDGGSVNVDVGAAVTTSGTNAVGVLAQSIGGGGGVAVTNDTALTYTAPSGGAGNGGAVTVNVSAPITTSGTGANGIIAQSASYGGGLVMNGTTMEEVTGVVVVNIETGGSVVTTGTGATAIYAQGSGDPDITVAAGANVIGGAGGTAITSDGTETHIHSAGTLATVEGGEGLVIKASGGFAEVVNAGTIIGNFSLAQGEANRVENQVGGTIWAGSTLDLGGVSGTLTNSGTLRSAALTFGGTSIAGNFIQTQSGVLSVRTDLLAGRTDRLDITGHADLSGTVRGSLSNTGRVVSGHFDQTILTALGGVSASNLRTAGDTAIVDFTLSTSTSGLTLGTSVDFTPAGLSNQGQVIGALVSTIQARGSSSVFQEIVPQLLNVGTTADLESAYETVGGGAVSMVPQTMVNAASNTIASVTSQLDLWRSGLRSASSAGGGAPVASGPQGDDDAAISAARYLWAGTAGSLTTGGNLSGSTFGGSVGLDGEWADLPVLLGAAVTLSTASLSVAGENASVTTNYGGASLYGMYTSGASYVSAIATLGYAHAGFDRTLFQSSYSADTGFDGTLFGARIEMGYRFALAAAGLNLTPFAAFQPMGLWLGGADESFGRLGPGLQYEATTITSLPTYLGMQIEGRWTASDGQVYIPSLRAAWMHDFSPDRDVPRSFAELPGLTFSDTAIPTVSDALDLHAGLQFAAGGNITLSAGLDAQIASGYSTLGASGVLRLRW